MGGGVLLLLLLLLPPLLLGTGRAATGQEQPFTPHTSTITSKRSPREASQPNASLQEDLTPKTRPGGNLVCYSCKLDFRKREYEKNHPCLGRHENLRVSEDYAVPCGPNDTFCRVERTEVNGVLTMLRRECTDTCYPGCRLKGFGINNELCEMCCGMDKCNHVYPTSGASGVTRRAKAARGKRELVTAVVGGFALVVVSVLLV